MQLDRERFDSLTDYSGEYATGRYVFGTIGRLFARALMGTRVTPNQITWVWGGMMAASALLFATGERALCTAGGLLWVAAYGLDYTDGAIAKYKGICSDRGDFLDRVIHRVTYPMLMFCIGYGVYVQGGRCIADMGWVEDCWYLFLGAAGGIGMTAIIDISSMYKDYPHRSSRFQGGNAEGSMGMEAGLVKDRALFKRLMNLNPLVFTNMMVLLPVAAAADLMPLFIIVYGIGYAAAAAGRALLAYSGLD